MRYEPVRAWLSVSGKKLTFFCFDWFFPVHFVAKRYILRQEVSERTNKDLV